MATKSAPRGVVPIPGENEIAFTSPKINPGVHLIASTSNHDLPEFGDEDQLKSAAATSLSLQSYSRGGQQIHLNDGENGKPFSPFDADCFCTCRL